VPSRHEYVVLTSGERQLAGGARDSRRFGCRIADKVPDRFVPRVASHPQRDSREAEEKGQDRQGVEQSPTKDCEGTMSHQMEIVSKVDPQSSAAGLERIKQDTTL
jgi:hypothetical protein